MTVTIVYDYKNSQLPVSTFLDIVDKIILIIMVYKKQES